MCLDVERSLELLLWPQGALNSAKEMTCLPHLQCTRPHLLLHPQGVLLLRVICSCSHTSSSFPLPGLWCQRVRLAKGLGQGDRGFRANWGPLGTDLSPPVPVVRRGVSTG